MHDVFFKFSRYLVTGGVAALVDIGAFALLLTTSAGVPLSTGASFCIAALVNYVLTSRFVFRREQSLARFILFFAAALLGLTVNVAATVAAIMWLLLPPIEAKIVGISVALLVNFSLNLIVDFRARPQPVGRLQNLNHIDPILLDGARGRRNRPRKSP